MKSILSMIVAGLLAACTSPKSNPADKNLFYTELNVATEYARITASHIDEYGNQTKNEAIQVIEGIKSQEELTFENTFQALDDISFTIGTTQNKCFALYWVSPDSLIRVKGLAINNMLDSLYNNFASDKELFGQLKKFQTSSSYSSLNTIDKRMVDLTIEGFEQSGINLEVEKLDQLKVLKAAINELTSQYSINMNTANEYLELDEAGTEGLSDNFKNAYATGDGQYRVPATATTRSTMLQNAKKETTRKAFYYKLNNRASAENLVILDSLISKRYQIAKINGYNSYAAYNLNSKMAKNPQNVWAFINDLIEKSKPKAMADLKVLKDYRNKNVSNLGTQAIQPWNINYFTNEIMKSEYKVDQETIREYLPMDQCLSGMMDVYQALLGLEFRKVENGSVWHDDVEMYEVFENEHLKARFYLDLFPRPNKESWFYGVTLKGAKLQKEGYDIPESMLLGNFPQGTDSLPSLITFSQLNTLFHEFGHIMDAASDNGKYASLQGSKSDFVESMSQIFENWIWDYETLSSFAKHYSTGEVLPKVLFDKMKAAKNFQSGYGTLRSLRMCMYDLNLYDKYDPTIGLDTDDLWNQIDLTLGIDPLHVAGTHPQASWIHINTHPVYYYGYLWSEVYAQDMFTVFEKNGLKDTKTGLRYRDLILSNGNQRDIDEAVEAFIGRPSNNEAYIKSLGLE